MHLTSPADANHAFAGVLDRLSARLQTGTDAPLALGLSGGGDSLALLKLALAWAQTNGRRILALTVDHALNPDSAGWTVFARDAALAVGADWQGLSWQGPKPVTGLPAAARRARHALLAEAARASGARVILLGHTADDVAEGDWMRAEGSTLGRVREWSPSPVWPQGRGLMVLRPMLEVRRQALRDWLTAQGEAWIDDPANQDLKYARSRARSFLLPLGAGEGATAPSDEGLRCLTTLGPDTLTLWRKGSGDAAVRSSPLPSGEGSITLNRSVSPGILSFALVCAGGFDRMPRGDRLASLAARLVAGDTFTATLCGARLNATPDHILIHREAGEFMRRPPPDIDLTPCVEAIWDGRWAITVDEPGWTVTAAAGRMAALSEADRAVLKSFPPAARPTRPVLIRNGSNAPVLAGTTGLARSLVEQRLALALDAVTHERHLS